MGRGLRRLRTPPLACRRSRSELPLSDSHVAPDRHPFITKLERAWSPSAWHGCGVVAAVSGGPDSVALLRALAELRQTGGGRLLVAHFNHGLRPEAKDDEQFVLELASRLGLECRVGQAGVCSQGDGLEAAAREARYAFLHETAHQFGARYIALAHTADDQVETILHHLVRGTGLAGLAGMPRSRPLDTGLALIRPLLGIRRSEILDYLAAIGQPYRTDASNADLRHTRNRVRRLLVPLLAEHFNPQVHEALLRLARLAGESQDVMRSLANDLAEQCVVTASEQSLEIDVRRAAAQPACVLREMFVGLWKQQGWPLQAMGLDAWDQLAEAARAGQAACRFTLPGEIHVEPHGERLRLFRAPRTR